MDRLPRLRNRAARSNSDRAARSNDPQDPQAAPTGHVGVTHIASSIAASFGLLWSASPRRCLFTFGPQVLSGFATGAQLIVVRDVVASVLARNERDTSQLWMLLVALCLLALITNVLGVLHQQQLSLLSADIERYQNGMLLDRVSTIDLKRWETPEFQDLQRRAMNAMGRALGITAAAVGLGRDLFLVIGIAAALYLLEPLLLALSVIGVIPLCLVTRAVGRETYGFFRSMTQTERIRAYVLGLFTSPQYAKEMRSFMLGPHFKKLYERLSNERMRDLSALLRTRVRLSLVTAAAAAAVMTATYGVLAYLVIQGRIGIPEATVAVAASQQLAGQLSSLMTNAGLIYESSLFLSDWEALGHVARRSSPVRRSGPVGQLRELCVEHVSFSYPNASTSSANSVPAALTDVSITIRAGEIVALVGENGSGKTTLAKIVSGLYRPDTGRMLWNGRDTSLLDDTWTFDHVAVLFQDYARFMFSVRENIGLGRVERIDDDAAIARAADRAGARTFIDAWPSNYDTMLGPQFDGGRDASLGQWQRIALARAIFRDADLVILDEPTAALDARAEYELFSRMRELFAERAMLLISHRFSSVRFADRIYVLDKGHCLESGTHDELIAREGLYADLYSIQAAAYVASAQPASRADRRDLRGERSSVIEPIGGLDGD